MIEDNNSPHWTYVLWKTQHKSSKNFYHNKQEIIIIIIIIEIVWIKKLCWDFLL